jgi:general secretion pathway protein D
MMKRFTLALCILIGLACPSLSWAQPAPTIGPRVPSIAPLTGPKRIKPILSRKSKKALSRLGKAKKKKIKPIPSKLSSKTAKTLNSKTKKNSPKKDTKKRKNDAKKRKKDAKKRKNDAEKESSFDSKPKGWQSVEGKGNENQEISSDFIKKCRPLKPGVKVTLNIYDEELSNITKIIACMTGKNIIVPKSLKGKKITIYSPSVVSSEEAYRAFLTALEANGFTISRQGRFLRIVDIKDFVRKSDPLKKETDYLADEDQMVTQILNLKHVDASEINEVLSKLASSNAQFIVYQPSNSLIVTELSSNLRRLRQLIKELDQPGGQEELWVYQVIHAEASDIASKINELFEKDSKSNKSSSYKKKKKKKKKKKGRRGSVSSTQVGESTLDARVSKVIADERTNRLLVVATRRSYRQVKRLIERLDISVEGDGQVHIHQLNHAKAVDLANVLSSLSQEQRSRGSSKRKKSSKKSKSRSRGKGKNSGSSSASLFEGEVSVTADEDTNSLVITASLKDYLALKHVISALDRPRRQVFIEAVIMEVSVGSSRDTGIASHVGYQQEVGGKDATLVLANPAGGSSVLDLQSAATLTGLAVQGPSLDINGITLPSFGAILRAVASNNDVNVLSTPHILTTDNEEAEIVVGDNVPFVSGFVGGMGAGSGIGGGGGGLGLLPTVNVQRQDVALTLKITPRINAANFVTLEIDQVVEEISRFDERLGPTTSKRSIKSTVVVRDQNTVVIGGLQKSKQSNSKTAFPILGEIPVLGYFFRSTKATRDRVNLLLMLTPHVIEGPEDFQAIVKRKMEEHEEFAERFHRDGEKLVLGLDYRKKHGLLESIHQSITEAEKEEAVLDELRRQESGPPLPQEQDGLDEEPEDVARENDSKSEVKAPTVETSGDDR